MKAQKASTGEPPNAYGKQDAWGNSVDSLRLNLRLSYAERLRKAEAGAAFAREFKGAIYRNKPV